MKRLFCFFLLIVYFSIVLHLAVLSRDTIERKTPIRMELFQDYFQPNKTGYLDSYINIALFVPFGLVVGLLGKRNKVVIAIIVGFLCSLIIESSQLIWKKGTFDINDLFNNTIGALIGVLIAMSVLSILKQLKQNKDCFRKTWLRRRFL